MFALNRAVPWLGGTTLALSLAACGGSSEGPGAPRTPDPTPTPCTQTTVIQEAGGIPGLTLVYDDFSVPDSGRLDVTLDWTNATSPIGFYLVPANTCTLDEFNARSCNFVIRSETTTKPRKISTPNFAAGNYRWIIANYSEDQESASLLIVLSKGSCPALAVGPAAASQSEVDWPAIERAQHH